MQKILSPGSRQPRQQGILLIGSLVLSGSGLMCRDLEQWGSLSRQSQGAMVWK